MSLGCDITESCSLILAKGYEVVAVGAHMPVGVDG